MEIFGAATQYGDWQGACAADNADLISVNQFLDDRQLKQRDEFAAGVKVSFGLSVTGNPENVSIKAFLVAGRGLDDAKRTIGASIGPLETRVVTLQISLGEFLRLFRGIEIALSRKDCALNGAHIIPV